MKGLVLAGGSGRRLRPFTHTGAKQLICVANRPVLYYVIDDLIAAGITDIGVIVSPETGGAIRAALASAEEFGARFTFVEQPRPGGLAHAVTCAEAFLAGEPFGMYLGDNLLGGGIVRFAEAFATDPAVAALTVVARVPDPSAFGVAEVDDRGRVVSVAEKPTDSRSDLALVGVYFFRPAIFAAIAAIRPSSRGELEITDAIGELIHRGETVRSTRLTSWWVDVGSGDDILRANAAVLDDRLRPARLGRIDAASQLSGPVRVERGAVVERSHIDGPVVVGRGARVVDAVVGPCTSIGDRAQVIESRVVRSVLAPDSVIRGVDQLADSVIGRRVRVERRTPCAGGFSLFVGDDSTIVLSS